MLSPTVRVIVKGTYEKEKEKKKKKREYERFEPITLKLESKNKRI